jgi:hypothetical protein
MKLLALALLPLFALSCSRSSHSEKINEPKPALQSLSNPQKTDLEQKVLSALSESYAQLNPNEQWANQAARVHLNKIMRVAVSMCDLSLIALPETQKCLILEVVIQNPAEPKINLDSATLSKISHMLSKIQSINKELELLAGQIPRENMPFIAKSFFADRRFVLTTSLQQGSVGNSRVYNLEALSVTLTVNSDRLVVLQNKAGLFPSSDSNDLIVTSYPIAATRIDGSETYFQIDFSKPENSKMFRNALYEGGDPALDITADVVVPSIAHKPKALNPALKSGQYFNLNDKNLVVDSLILLTGEFQPNGADLALGKDALHPTVRVVQGLFAETEQDAIFAKTQSKEVSQLAEAHLSTNTIDLSEGQDVPFFTTNSFLGANSMGKVGQKSMVKKFDASQDIVFVLSANTPPKAVPVLKAALQSYNDLFAAFKKDQNTTIKAFSAEEFANHVRTTASDLPEFPIAADPRVNMISWSDDDALGAAWATTVANPFTGRMISGDVMMSGSLWAKVGCSSYLSKVWAAQVTKGEKLSSLIVPDELRQKWSEECSVAMKELGLNASVPFGPTNNESSKWGAVTVENDFAALPFAYINSFNQNKASTLNALLKPSTEKASSESVTLKLGKNTLRIAPPCTRNPEDSKFLDTNFGAPGLDTRNVKSPTEGALAMVRAVSLHELGHLFGLRHNFAGSLRTAKITSESPVPLADQSDSFMDYNDYAVDMSAGAMTDYTDFTSGNKTPSFGAYDVLALSQIYDLNTAALTFESKPSFCTDGNVRRAGGIAYGECKPDDYGTDGVSFALFQLNQSLLTLRAIGLPLDASGGFRLQNQLVGAIKALTYELFIAQEKLVKRSVVGAEKEALIQKIKAITLAETNNPMLARFANLSGLKLVGLFEALHPQEQSFENANDFLRKFDALIAVRAANNSFVQTISELSGYRRSMFGDAKFAPVFQDIAGVPEFNWKTQFINQKAADVILPKGTAVEFSYFDEGKVVAGAEAKFQGTPVQFILDEPMLNHNKILRVKKLKITDAAGTEKEVLATVAGKYNIDDLKQLAASVAILDPYGELAQKRLNEGKVYLGCVSGLQLNNCPASESLPLLDISLVAAKSLFRTYERLEAFTLDPDAP